MIYRFLYTAFLFLIISNYSTVSAQKSKSNTIKLDRVLIVGMTNDYNARDMYERELSYRLREKGYNMFSSVNVDTDKKELYTKEELLALVDEKHVNGVITMRLIDITTKEKYATSDRYISDMSNNHNYFFNYIDTYYNVYSWSYQPQQRVVVEANLFDASDKSLIFKVDYTSENAESPEERAGELTKKFAKALHKSGFLKKKNK